MLEFFKDEKDSYDNEDDDKTKIDLSIPNIQTIFSEINKGKITDELKFFSGGDELRTQAIRPIGYLNKVNTAFLCFSNSLFGLDISDKNKMKIHLESEDIYIGNVNNSENIYIFYYLNKMIQKSLWMLNLQ